MDRFEELLEWLRVTGKHEAGRRMASLANEQCICPACPLFSDCSREKQENLFCVIGSGKDCSYDASLEGCLCPQCPLTEDFDLTKTYYCALGSEKQLREVG
jgi:hypothetical protein